MWKCPVCDQENNAATVCPTCGYDRTCDYERYPTAFTVKRATPTHTLRRQWQAKQNPPTNPQPTAPAAPAKKKGSLWTVLLAVAVIAIVIAVVKFAGGGSPSVEYTVDYAGYYVNIRLDGGTISAQTVEDTQKLLKKHSCTRILISGGTVDAAAMEQISKLTDVKEIDFYRCTKVSGFDRLSGMSNLSCIHLKGSSESESELDLTGIERIGALRKLIISDAKSIDLEKLKNAAQLIDLEVRRCNITSLNGLENLTNLTSLRLGNNQISDLQPLSPLVNLEGLNVSNNQISDLQPLSALVNLEILNVSDNQISDL